MDLIKELAEIEKQSTYGEKVLIDLNEEKNQLEKKIYLTRVFSIAKKVDEYIKSNKFALYNIDFLQINCHKDSKIGYFTFIFYSADKEKNPENMRIQTFNKFQEEFLTANLKSLSGKSEFLNEEFPNQASKTIKLENGAGEIIITLLLSKELKNILHYNRMQLGLANNNEKSSKKLKV